MNSDENSKVIDMIRSISERLAPQIGDAVRTKDRKKPGGSHWGSKNHSKKRNKKRYLMAKKSNNINRKRIKGWKY